MQHKIETPKDRFPCPVTELDEMCLTEADFRLTPKEFKHKRMHVKDLLEGFLPERPVIVVGVLKKIQVTDGTEQGAMHPARAYQIARADFIKLKMDPYRSPFIVVLEPKVPCMYFEVCSAINKLWPSRARNTFLSAA